MKRVADPYGAGHARGALRNSRLGAAAVEVLEVARRHPFPVMLMAAGAGWLAYSLGKRSGQGRSWLRRMSEAEQIPVLNTGQVRIYDPDASPRHPTQDSLESRREMSARL